MRQKVMMLYDSDSEIVDFMADLEDRSPLASIQKGLNHNKLLRGAILTEHKKEGIVTLLLLNDPFEFRSEPNVLTLFTADTIAPMLLYFQCYLESVADNDKDRLHATKNIISLLSTQKEKIEYKQTQTNFMG